MNRYPDEPWRTDHWVTSRHNFDPAIEVPPHSIELHDITVRDGEECADLAFNVDDKVRIAEALALVGVPRMEMFLTVPGWLEAVRAILARKLPQKLVVTWDPGRTERAVDLGVRDIMAIGYTGSPVRGYDIEQLLQSIGNFLVCSFENTTKCLT